MATSRGAWSRFDKWPVPSLDCVVQVDFISAIRRAIDSVAAGHERCTCTYRAVAAGQAYGL